MRVTGHTMLNILHGNGDGKYKKVESIEKNHVARAATKAVDIYMNTALGKYNLEKLEAIGDNNKRVEAVGKLTKPKRGEGTFP